MSKLCRGVEEEPKQKLWKMWRREMNENKIMYDEIRRMNDVECTEAEANEKL